MPLRKFPSNHDCLLAKVFFTQSHALIHPMTAVTLSTLQESVYASRLEFHMKALQPANQDAPCTHALKSLGINNPPPYSSVALTLAPTKKHTLSHKSEHIKTFSSQGLNKCLTVDIVVIVVVDRINRKIIKKGFINGRVANGRSIFCVLLWRLWGCAYGDEIMDYRYTLMGCGGWDGFINRT